jgi:hypothetical protein
VTSYTRAQLVLKSKPRELPDMVSGNGAETKEKEEEEEEEAQEEARQRRK